MLALLFVGAGLLLIVGARHWGVAVLKFGIAVALVVSLLPLVLGSCRVPRSADDGAVLLVAIGVLGLALAGALLWKGRGDRERHETAFLRRHGQPRRRLPPPAPLADGAEGGPSSEEGLR